MRSWESVKPGNVETLEERAIYLGMSQLRGILNPNITREEEQAGWDQYHQAAMESITKRAKALEAANRKLVLSPEAVKALGPVSPELAWDQIRNSFMGAILDYSETARGLAQWEGLPKSEFSTEGLENLAASMQNPGVLSAGIHDQPPGGVQPGSELAGHRPSPAADNSQSHIAHADDQ